MSSQFEFGGHRVTSADVEAAPLPSKGEAGLFTHILALSIGAGVPAMESLVSAASTISNAKLRLVAYLMYVAVREGGTLASVHADDRVRGILPNLWFYAVDLGEEVGELNEALAKCARYLNSTPGATFRRSVGWPPAMEDFARGLYLCMDVGLSVLRSIRILERDTTDPSLRAALAAVCDEIEGGATLSEALATQPAVFPPAFLGIIKAGETSGALNRALALVVGD